MPSSLGSGSLPSGRSSRESSPARFERVKLLRNRCLAMLDQLDNWEPANTVENSGSSWTLVNGSNCVWPGNLSEKTPIEGLLKLKASIEAELRFLDTLYNSPDLIKDSHVNSTNVPNLEVVLASLATANNPTAVFKPFQFSEPCPTCHNGRYKRYLCVCPPNLRQGLDKSVKVDLVVDHGCTWIKVRASNARAVEYEFLEDPNYVSDDDDPSRIFAIQKRRATTVAANPVHGKVPRVIFRFTAIDELDARVADLLTQAGIEAEVVPAADLLQAARTRDFVHDASSRNACSSLSQLPPLSPTLNLDGSTLIALVSDLSHSHTMAQYASTLPSFATQLDAETATPLLAPLISLLSGHRLVVTERALAHFVNILRTVAGPKERLRAMFLLPDLATPGDIAHGHDGVSMPVDVRAETEAKAAGLAWRTHRNLSLVPTWLHSLLGALLTDLEPIDPHPDLVSDMFAELQAVTQGNDKYALEAAKRAHMSGRERARQATSGENKARIVYVNGRKPGKVKWMHASVFGTSHACGFTTVTANLAIVRSVQELGVPISVWVHQPRSLTEQKSMMAARVQWKACRMQMQTWYP
ncbi:hypothetical protein BCR44DRAFT_1485336 [Catenaria anguillulae PL171]|uniref:DUF1308 domain-containing protein n=1 Tax=Catenaria anguillulae PL171 TaxID=765915 RepID=A0A1Y2HNT5_9FUNG|nr:hypothetical protein BCR44DRAFT_1485336 [Catenaria anguillulae PL171]